MKAQRETNSSQVNDKRRKLLKGAAVLGAATTTPVVFGNTFFTNSDFPVSGKLICKIFDPVKTLVLSNHSDQDLVIDQLNDSAFMYDGSIVDCNTACLHEPITIPAHQEIQVRFDRRQQNSLNRQVHEYVRVQSRVERLSDGTRVIPFTVTVRGTVAKIV